MTPPFSAHIGYLFTELTFSERFAAAARHGFVAVENPEPYRYAARDMKRWLDDAGLAYVQFGAIGDSGRGDKGLAALPERVDECRQLVSRLLDYGAEIGCSMLHVLAGLRPAGSAFKPMWDCYLENVAFAADLAAARGMTIIIEPMSADGAPGYFLDDPDMAAEAIRLVGRHNVRMMVDVFHTANAGIDPAALLRRYGQIIGHVHLADHPGRHEPGSGTVDFAAIRQALDEIGYEGYLGCEYVPAVSTEAGLGWRVRF